MRGENGHEHQKILQPMLRSQGTDVFREACPLICKRAFVVRALLFNGSQQSRAWIDHNGLPRRGPHREIARLIAGIVEAVLPELTDETRSLTFSGEIGVPIAGQDQIEELEVIGNLAGETLIAGGRENDRSPLAVFGAEVLEKRGAVGKERRVDVDAPGNLMLQVCPPLQ